MQFDVIIIGSGPAGCSAAISCKRQGLLVAMITGRPESSDVADTTPQPSESIHPGVASVLAGLGAGHCIAAASQGTYEGIEAAGQYNALGEDESGAWQGHHINRVLFDAALLQAAGDQHITLVHDTVTEITSAEGRVTGVRTAAGTHIAAQYVIDASGYKRIAGKALGFQESFYSPPLVTWTGVSECITLDEVSPKKNYTRFIPHSNGWTWLAPHDLSRCTWTQLEVKGKQQFLPPEEMKGYTLVSEIKKSNRRWRAFRPVCREGILLCGDAAAILDAAAGQGILNALVSGAMAAKTVKSCLATPAFEALYLAKYDDWLISDYTAKVARLRHFYDMHGIKIFEKQEAGQSF